jgi:hypothetical protein|tara:strand:+ start:221 stop:517 length:297 start_codon:yes stop_codon:yes gene_type:complete
MQVIRWSNGEEYKWSKKEDKPILNSNNEIIKNLTIRSEQPIQKKKDKEYFFKKAELESREMMVQTYVNPFLNKKFREVVEDQEKFLRPKNSLFDNLNK